MPLAGDLATSLRAIGGSFDRGLKARLNERVTASLEPDGLPRLPLFARYFKARYALLSWAIRSGRLTVSDGLNVVGALVPRPGETVFDIGANIGWITERAAVWVGPTGRVHAFEPSPTAAAHLRRRVRALSLGNVVVNECALGSAEESAFLYEFAENHGGASSLRPDAWPGHQPQRETRVSVRTLDAYLAEHAIERVALIKLDVQGAEPDVLVGGQRLLSRRDRPVLYLEVERDACLAFQRTPDELLGLVRDFGYQTFSWRAAGLVPVTSSADLPADGHDDVICLAPDQHAAVREQLRSLAAGRPRTERPAPDHRPGL